MFFKDSSGREPYVETYVPDKDIHLRTYFEGAFAQIYDPENAADTIVGQIFTKWVMSDGS